MIQEGNRAAVDDTLLASLVDDEDEEEETMGVEKIKHAMNRTEALRKPVAWNFFNLPHPGREEGERQFPVQSPPLNGWLAVLEGERDEVGTLEL